jgi:membrane associated rhomboid family serine protease
VNSGRDLSPDSVFDLSAGGASLLLEDRGVRLRLHWRKPAQFVPYADVTHLGVSARGLWLGTRRTVVFLRRQRFASTDGPERLVGALVSRIGGQPGGLRQLARMREIDHLVRRSSPRAASTAVAAVCVAVFALQLADPFVQEAGAFVPGLVAQGEVWRLVTANFLHALLLVPLHILFNLLALLGFAFLVERPLGPLRTTVVMGAAGLASMAASGVAGYPEVVGASGIVAGMAGAALCLELQFADRIPAWWRIPRRLFVGVLLIEGLYGFLVPAIAGAAHLGGFAAGYLAALALADSALARRRAEPWVRTSATGVVLVTALSFAAAAPLVLRDGAAMERYGRDLLAAGAVAPARYNDLAWRIATEAEPDREQLEVALQLAQRAVRETERLDPDLLDTLAEVHFALGERDLALGTIDEAIALSPGDRYFREQRRRFTGERAAEDRPEAPDLPWVLRRPPQWDAPEEPPAERGIEI